MGGKPGDRRQDTQVHFHVLWFSAPGTRSLHSRTTEAADIVGDRQYGGILSMGTVTGIEVAVIYPWCCALAKVGRVSKRTKVIETEGPQSGAHMLRADPNKGPSLPLTPGPFKCEGT